MNLNELSKEDLLKENEHLQKLINNLARKNTELTVTLSNLEVINEQLTKDLEQDKAPKNK